MADNVPITPGTGTSIAADDVGSVFYQRVKVALGPDGVFTADADGTAARGIYVDPRPKVVRLAVTPTVSTTPAYTAKDAIGALMTFTNAVRVSGGTGWIESVQIEDKGQQMAALDLLLFDRSVTAPTDNAIYNPSDAEVANCIGVVKFTASDWSDFSTNSVAHRTPGIQFVANGADLYGVLVNRGAPTYTSVSDIVVTITILQD